MPLNEFGYWITNEIDEFGHANFVTLNEFGFSLFGLTGGVAWSVSAHISSTTDDSLYPQLIKTTAVSSYDSTVIKPIIILTNSLSSDEGMLLTPILTHTDAISSHFFESLLVASEYIGSTTLHDSSIYGRYFDASDMISATHTVLNTTSLEYRDSTNVYGEWHGAPWITAESVAASDICSIGGSILASDYLTSGFVVILAPNLLSEKWLNVTHVYNMIAYLVRLDTLDVSELRTIKPIIHFATQSSAIDIGITVPNFVATVNLDTLYGVEIKLLTEYSAQANALKILDWGTVTDIFQRLKLIIVSEKILLSCVSKRILLRILR